MRQAAPAESVPELSATCPDRADKSKRQEIVMGVARRSGGPVGDGDPAATGADGEGYPSRNDQDIGPDLVIFGRIMNGPVSHKARRRVRAAGKRDTSKWWLSHRPH